MHVLLNSRSYFIRRLNLIYWGIRNLNSEVPEIPHISRFKCKKSTSDTTVDIDTIAHLERLSLVNFGNLKGVKILESAIKFSEQIFMKDTTGVEPLTTVLENRVLHLRDDVVKDGNCRKSVMSNAKITEEDYFVAPPGNIPLEPQNQEILKKKNQDRKLIESIRK